MSSLFKVVLLLLSTSGAVTLDWKDIFKPKPLHGLSPQCLNDTQTWIKSLELFAGVSEACLKKQTCSLKELKILKANLYAIQGKQKVFIVGKKVYFQNSILSENCQFPGCSKLQPYMTDLIKNASVLVV